MGSLGSLMEKPQHSEKKSLCLLYTVGQRDELLHAENKVVLLHTDKPEDIR